MLSNRKRTIVTVLGVIISVAMITAVSTAAETFTDFMQRIEMNYSGHWHVSYNNVNLKQIETINDKMDCNNTFLTRSIGYSLWQDSNDVSKPYIYMDSFDTKAFQSMPIKLIEGRFPKNVNEVLITEQLSQEGKKKYYIGDTLKLEPGYRYMNQDGVKIPLNQKNEYTDSREDIEDREFFETTGIEKEYKIVGIIERPDWEISSSPGYTAITYMDDEMLGTTDTVNESLFIKDVTQAIYSESSKAAVAAGVDTNSISYNSSLLRYYGVSQYEDTYNMMIKGFSFILIAIIMIGSIALIYNSFAISINERSKQFGMLTSVGTTKEQKRNAVLFEGFAIGALCIPLGILSGFFGMWVTFKCVSPIFMEALNINIPIKIIVSYQSIIVAVIFSIITIFLSAFLPARKASKISPIEAIRQSKDIQIKAKSIRTWRAWRALFGLEGDLALKNLKRNKKQYRALVFSLAISMILFISVGSYVYYLKESLSFTSDGESSDVIVTPLSYEQYDSVESAMDQVEHTTDYSLVLNDSSDFKLDKSTSAKYMTQDYKEYLKEKLGDKDIVMKDYQFSLHFYFLEDTDYSDYLKQLGGTNINGNMEAVLVNTQRSQIGYSIRDLYPTNIQAGDILSIERNVESVNVSTNTDNNSENQVTNPLATVSVEPMEISVSMVTDKLPMGVFYESRGGGVVLIMAKSQINKMLEDNYKNVTLDCFINTNKPKLIENEIKVSLLKSGITTDYSIINQVLQVKKNNQIIGVFTVFAYGFITLISLICIANLLNTISTSFALRRKEFAMLKSVGMTSEVFHKMIMMESLLYGVKATVFGIPISILFTLWIRSTVRYNFTMEYAFPYQTYIVGIAAVFLIVGVAMLYSTRKVRKENIIDALKADIS
jgi:putative ABC transport system permease protein